MKLLSFTAKDSVLARIKPYPQASALTLVQPFTAFRPLRFATRMGDSPRLDACYPGPRRSGKGCSFATLHSISERKLKKQ
jgi:hypothetical protein